MELSDIIQIVIGILSLIATIAVSFMIHWLEMRHEKELQRLEEKQKKKELEEKARCFLIDHESERDYLPWCVLAANLHRLQKHIRVIYTEFCRCPEELRNEILKQAGFEISSIKEQSWVDTCIERLKADIKKYNLGRDYLYDGAKYFHRSFARYRDLTWEGTPAVFEPICKVNRVRQFSNRKTIDIGSYVKEYFDFYLEDHMKSQNVAPRPPMDYVWESQRLADAEESVVCLWMMELVESISTTVGNKNCVANTSDYWLDNTDAVAETYEDKYYSALQSLYNTYYSALIVKKKKLCIFKKRCKPER